MNTTVLKALLWKDYRQNRMLFVTGLAMLVVVPMIVCLLLHLVNSAEGVRTFRGNHMFGVAVVSLIPVSCLIVAMLGGTIIAADRADRSAAFLAFLPPSRSMVVLSKVLCALSAICLLVIINYTSWASALLLFHANGHDILVGSLPVVATGLLLFGTAWFAGSLTGSPAIATGIGIGFVVVLFAVLFFINNNPGTHLGNDQDVWYIYCVIAAVVGLACFIAGCLHSLYRKTEV
jgi:ABC-type transport system involved in multi-copper enzyme maturation permease subunit